MLSPCRRIAIFFSLVLRRVPKQQHCPNHPRHPERKSRVAWTQRPIAPGWPRRPQPPTDPEEPPDSSPENPSWERSPPALKNSSQEPVFGGVGGRRLRRTSPKLLHRPVPNTPKRDARRPPAPPGSGRPSVGRMGAASPRSARPARPSPGPGRAADGSRRARLIYPSLTPSLSLSIYLMTALAGAPLSIYTSLTLPPYLGLGDPCVCQRP